MTAKTNLLDLRRLNEILMEANLPDIKTDRDNVVREAAKRILGQPSGPQHDYILLDRSGSMGVRWNDTVGGVNAYIQALGRNAETSMIKVTVAVFDAPGAHALFGVTPCSFDIIRRGVEACHCNPIGTHEAQPRGGTPLYDAIGKIVALAREDNPDRSAIVIVTDGEENSSREMNIMSANAMLNVCRERGWQVIMLGADFNNVAQAQSLGNAYAQTMSSAAQNMAGALAATASYRNLYGATGQSINFSDEDREAAVKPKAP